MKRLCFAKSNNTKRGVASLYVVIFATMLFGVVTLSFIRIVVNEAGQSSDDDLSRSAYDSAMAGVEDAKTAVNDYYNCLRKGNSPASCNATALFQDNCNNGEIGLAKYLYKEAYSSGEILLQEGEGVVGETSADQAYTCVIISDKVPDYRGTLSKDTRTKVVPLRIKSSTSNVNANVVNSVNIRWFSTLNQGGKDLSLSENNQVNSEGRLDKNENRTIPPTISVSFIQVKGSAGSANLNISDFHSPNNSSNMIYSSMAFVPSSINKEPSAATPQTRVEAGKVAQMGNLTTQEAVDAHDTIKTNCFSTTEFACSVSLGANIDANDTAFLVISLPYDETIVDFSVDLQNGNNIVDFDGVQISVDSTGRTNQLVRRVETRLDPADLYFPYPQYEIEATGDGESNTIDKYFWITNNFWYSQPTRGTMGSGPNNGRIQ